MFSKSSTASDPPKIHYVTKRNGEIHPINLEEIKARLEKLSFGLDRNYVNIDAIVQKVIQGMYDKVPTAVLDNLAAETSAYMNILHPHYSLLAARIVVDNLHKETRNRFSETISLLYHYVDKTGRNSSLISKDVYEIVMNNAEAIEKVVNYERDFNYDFFGFKTLERSYLLKLNGKIAERPQDMLMRVSIGIHKEDLESAFETYNLMSDKWFTHATPTLFNSGTPNPQMSSCFLLTMKDDSLDGIYDTLKQCALISKSAGGIGLAIHCIRAKDSYIRGTNGVSNGLIPMLRVFNDTARYVDQGGGKRKGSFAMYLEPWHADIYEFIELRKNHGKEENRARDLFLGLWIPDLFMERVESDLDWTLMCPNECPGLPDVWGEAFVELYTKYEKEGRGRKTVKARQLFFEIIESQIETGVPYMLFKDACNRKSNQQNLGTIKSSNLCTEIIEYTSKDEVAVCNLASINLARFVDKDGVFDYEKLIYVADHATKNLNKVIDVNYYPIEEARNSNLRHRPIGLGVQGLADAFIKMKVSFESEEALKINEKIFETIYYAACKASMEISKKLGPYTSFQGSPCSKGLLQFDLCNKVPVNYNWDSLKKDIVKYGMRNSLLIAPMPTASTSQILGNNESFEPYTSNLYTRRVLSGEFVCINSHLVKDLIAADLWSPSVKNKLIAFGGSVQNITEIPQEIKDLYKTVWEIPQKRILDLAISRAPFIDQSQSLNIHLAEPNFSKMSSMHFYAWKAGLKTGMYYLRSRPAADAIKFTLDVESLVKEGVQKEKEKEIQAENERIAKKEEIDKENALEEPPIVKKIKTEANCKRKTVCGEDVCYSCGS